MKPKKCFFIVCLFVSGICIAPVPSLKAELYQTFDVYGDGGIPAGSSVWTWDEGDWGGPDATFNGDYPDTTAPEGSKCFRVDNPGKYAGWGVFFPSGIDLSNYFTPSDDINVINKWLIKFWVKTPVNLKVQLESVDGIKKTRYLNTEWNVKKWDGSNSWQEIWIPIKWFAEEPDGTFKVDFLRRLKSPFMITAETKGVTFYVDDVRWEKPVDMPGASKVQVIGRQLYVNGKVFSIKGICYSPIPVGQSPNYDWSVWPENYRKDFSLLKAMGCNTIRIFKPPTQSEPLDELYLNGIYVIIDYPIDRNANVSDPTTRQSIKTGFLNMVNTWKNHPAVLMWNLGDEMNGQVASRLDWYSLVNECASAAHLIDPNHPVTAACQEVPGGIETEIGDYDALVPDMDIWSVNLFRGPTFKNLFSTFPTKSSKPVLIAEFGCDAYSGILSKEDQDTQATCLESQWAEIKSNLSAISSSKVCIGGVVFEWNDEWWKHSGGANNVHDTSSGWTNPDYSDPSMNEEWWGVMSIASGTYHKTPRKAWYTLQGLWRETPLMAIRVRNVKDNIIPAQQLITWTNVIPGRDGWKLADQYLQIEADVSFPQWGIQIYTDNRNLGGGNFADPPYEGPEGTDPAGLVALDDHTMRIPLCWKITDEVWTTPEDPVEVPDPNIAYASYFSNNFLWLKDRGTPDNPQTPKNLVDETFVDGEYYVTVWDHDGIQWGGSPTQHGGGKSSPNYIYIGGKFTSATTPRTYRTKLVVEMYFP